MANTINDCKAWEEFAKEGKEEIIKHYQQYASVTDLEQEACKLSVDINKIKCFQHHKNILPEVNIDLLEYLLNVILEYRVEILDDNFSWNDEFKKQLLELNEKIKEGFTSAYNQAEAVFENLIDNLKSENAFLQDFNLSINLRPFILEPNEKHFFLEERGDESIYYVIYNKLQEEILWNDHIIIDRDNFNKSKKELKNIFTKQLLHKKFNETDFTMDINKFENINRFFDCCKFGSAWCSLISCRYLSWYDILKINEIWIEVNVTHQHFMENIGKGKFWDDGIQSLSDNEAENLRNEYMSRLSKRETGLPVEILVDDIGAWENIGNFRRIKFQGNKCEGTDHTKMYSMSIERKPRILVKNANIELSEDELNQIKSFVKKNKKELLQLGKQKISFINFIYKINKKIGRIIPE